MSALANGAGHTAGPDTSGLVAWVPRRLLIAIDIMLDVAFNGASGPLPAAELGARRGLETRQIEAVLQRLVRSNLLRSLRGPNGGYLLAGDRDRITLADIARSLAEPDRGFAAEDGASPSLKLVVLPLIESFDRELLRRMEAITLAQLCQNSRLAGLTSKCDDIVDFTI